MPKYTILLTASINPNGMSFTLLQDAALRKIQYIEAIRFYLENTNYKIVFCNNTGEDVSDNFVSDQKRIEFLSFQGNNFDSTLGKGYGEMQIIKYALAKSSFIKKTDYVIKITGRLIIKNLRESIIRTTLLNPLYSNKVFCNLIDVNNKFIDSRCFIANRGFIEDLTCYDIRINDTKGYYFEHLLYDAIYGQISNRSINMAKFIPELNFVGESGSSGEKYTSISKTYYEKLVETRNYCQNLKKNKPIIRYIYISMISFSVRMIKAIINRK